MLPTLCRRLNRSTSFDFVECEWPGLELCCRLACLRGVKRETSFEGVRNCINGDESDTDFFLDVGLLDLLDVNISSDTIGVESEMR